MPENKNIYNEIQNKEIEYKDVIIRIFNFYFHLFYNINE